jgi:hypothetical protein
MTHLNFNKQTNLWEITENKTGKVLAQSTGHGAACRIMDKWDDKLEAENTN